MRVIGYTKRLNKTRGEEIRAYLEELGGKVNYIIIDDDYDFDGFEECLIQTDYETGLTKEDVFLGIKKSVKKK